MGQIDYFLTHIMEAEDWPARWHCGQWSDFHGWLYICSDLAIAAAYFMIPLLLFYFSRATRSLKFNHIVILFAVFILACGGTHLMDAIMFWWPAYRLNAVTQLVTALASWLTVVSLTKVIPMALQLKTQEELEHTVRERTLELALAQETLARLNAELEKRVEERTRQVSSVNAALLTTAEQLTEAQRIASVGSWKLDVLTGEVEWSAEFDRLVGLKSADKRRGYSEQEPFYAPASWTKLKAAFDQAIATGVGYEIEVEVVSPSGCRWGIARGEAYRDSQGRVARLMGTLQDVSVRKQMELQLLQQSEELERSNKELEHFAYVASHDLQEPLRAVAGCSQILQRRWADKLDPSADELIKHIVEGVARMQTLIFDLLSYSQLSSRAREFASLEISSCLQQAIERLQTAISESSAQILVEKMPSVIGDGTQLTQLFQNLLGNALKYRGSRTPEIKIASRREGNEWIFSIEDNGIGIEPQYFDRIFVLFQRLHTRREYSGTGMGLAICKKIVERHQGRIWVESQLNVGSTFFFTILDGAF